MPYVGADVDKVENGFVLSHYMHLKQGSFDIAFKQLEVRLLPYYVGPMLIPFTCIIEPHLSS